MLSASCCQMLIAKCLFHQLRTGHDLGPGRRSKAKLAVWYFDVFLLLKKAEFGDRAIAFFHYDARDQSVRRDFQQSLLNAIAHSLWNPTQDHTARVERLLIGRQREAIQLLLQLGPA